MSWILALGGFAMLVVLHEAGHMVAAKAVGMRVERFFLFFPPKLVSFKRGETEYGIGAIPLGGFVKITGMSPEEEVDPEHADRAYWRQPVWKRIVVIAAGPAVNIVIALVIFFFIATGFGLNGDIVNRVDSVTPDSPAASGLQSGDRLISIDGTDVSALQGVPLVDAVRTELDDHRCEGEQTDGCMATTPVELEVLRGETNEQVAIFPELSVPTEPEAEQGAEPRMLLGFRYEATREKLSPTDAADYSVDQLWFVTKRTGEVFARIFDAEQRKQITGVVGATEVTRQSFEFDTRQAIGVLGIISLSLGLVNLLPFLPLDGGHIFWGVVEKIRGRRASVSTMERSGVVGFMLVALLFVIGLNNDLGKIFGEGFNVR